MKRKKPNDPLKAAIPGPAARDHPQSKTNIQLQDSIFPPEFQSEVFIRCHVCGAVYTGMWQFKRVYCIGLALFGDCAKCGTRLPAERLWRLADE